MDVELVVGVLAVAGLLAAFGLRAWAAGRRGDDRKRTTLGYLVMAVMEAVFAWSAVLMLRHVLADGSDLLWAAGFTVLAVLGVLAVVIDTLKAISGRYGDRSTPAQVADRGRDLARR